MSLAINLWLVALPGRADEAPPNRDRYSGDTDCDASENIRGSFHAKTIATDPANCTRKES